MAKFVMMSMVFMVVLLKSATSLFPKAIMVGGDTGWVVPKAKPYVGDTLIFQNKNIKHVKHVPKEAYQKCNESNTIEDLFTADNGQVNITLKSAEEYYFISPEPENCNRGMKLSISVSNSSPAVSVGVLVPMMAVVMGFFF